MGRVSEGPIYSPAMFPLLQSVQMLLLMFAGWVNRHQLDVIEYLQEENRVLKERMGGRRLRFTDAERRRLARKAQALGRNVLNEIETLVTPDTLLRWYRELVASKWDYSHRRGPGRPRVTKTIVDLILRMAFDNPSWGYTRIPAALANLGRPVGRGTIANVLKENDIEPAPERERAHAMVDLSEGSLGMSGSDGLPERRGLHIQRFCHALHSVLYRHRLSIRTRRGHHPSSRQFMDDADCTQRHRCGRWFSARQTTFDPRPRCEILRRIPHCSRARGYSRRSIAAAFAQFEFVRRKIRQIHKGRVPESDDLLWTGHRFGTRLHNTSAIITASEIIKDSATG